MICNYEESISLIRSNLFLLWNVPIPLWRCLPDIPNKMPGLVAGIIIARSSLSDVKCPVICNPNACDDGKIVRVSFSVVLSRHL
jgi:hypothetical protein